MLNIPRIHLKGLWCSGITSASHAEGPGFNLQQVHIATMAPHARLQYGKFFFSVTWTGSYCRKKLLHHQKTAACLDKSEEIAPHGPAAVSLQTCFFTATAVSLSPCPLRKPLSLYKKQLLRICYSLYPWVLGNCGFPGVSQGPQFRGHWLSVMWGVQS